MREDGGASESERGRQEQGPRESKDEAERGGERRTWKDFVDTRGERVYAGGMGALRARVQYLAR